MTGRASKSLTPWFNTEDTPPVHHGVYERDLTIAGLSDRQRFAYWNGKQWFGFAQNPDAAKTNFDYGFISGMQMVGLWRGLRRKS